MFCKNELLLFSEHLFLMAGKNRCSNSPNGQLAVKRPKMHFFEKNLFPWTKNFIFVGSKQKKLKKKSWGAHCLAQSSIFALTALERPRFNLFWFFCFRPLYCNLKYRFCTKKSQKESKKVCILKEKPVGSNLRDSGKIWQSDSGSPVSNRTARSQ